MTAKSLHTLGDVLKTVLPAHPCSTFQLMMYTVLVPAPYKDAALRNTPSYMLGQEVLETTNQPTSLHCLTTS
jgi:hypothetical protein